MALPVDAHVIGEPVIVTRIHVPGLVRAGLIASCRRGDLTYEVSLADVVFPAGSEGASLAARYRSWLGLSLQATADSEGARPHKVSGDDLVVGRAADLVVLACKSNALRCRLLGSAREVTLRTAVREEIPGSVITVTPKKLWTHARHPYLSGAVSAVRIEVSALGLKPLPLSREERVRGAAADGSRPVYRLGSVESEGGEGGALLHQAQQCLEAGAYAEAEELLHQVLALDLRYLDAHAKLGERNLGFWPTIGARYFELGVAIGGLSVAPHFDGVLPFSFAENRPFLRCLDGLARALERSRRREEAVFALRRLLRLDPADSLGAGARLAAIQAEDGVA
ncbi:MAG: hypothetical protein IPG45_15935 [Deltaproteobacteria bacterium]|nr:hypothetical protein [Deltaproteobacteria bacterium]